MRLMRRSGHSVYLLQRQSEVRLLAPLDILSLSLYMQHVLLLLGTQTLRKPAFCEKRNSPPLPAALLQNIKEK